MNSEKVYNYILKKITRDVMQETINSKKLCGVCASDIEKDLNISRGNASILLNDMVREGKLVKIETRPVLFLPTLSLSRYLDKNKPPFVFDVNQFFDLLRNENGEIKKDPFRRMIGYDKSLTYQIDQGKAAMIYPPNGLHSLLIGESGTGKTLFAKTMYEYGLIQKKVSEEKFPFVSFNCSDYFSNPELLLSQLFGHIKGSFTGADEDRIGLVEKANNGILFLDEVHRLPPWGQEMLFYLMDTGKFKKLGSSYEEKEVNVLIICATSEDPHESLLNTFLRRIPVTILLPSLKEKDISERIEIIEYHFMKEAVTINKTLIVSPEIIKALAIHDYKGNIGQLASEIKILCARTFLNYKNNEDTIKIDFSLLPKDIKDSIFNSDSLDLGEKEFLRRYDTKIIVDPTKDTIKYSLATILEENVYNRIIKAKEKCEEEGLSQEKIDSFISNEIKSYYTEVLNMFEAKDYEISELYKVVDKDIVDFSEELMNYASENLHRKYRKKNILGFSFHLTALIERVKENKIILQKNPMPVNIEYTKEYNTAKEIVRRIENRFNFKIPSDEINYICIFLVNGNTDTKEQEDVVGFLIISHGDSTASSMASVCNRLYGERYVYAIDMPLDRSVKDTYEEALRVVKEINNNKGILLFVDMGSLVDFGERIRQETGIFVRTINSVSTPMVLDSISRVINKNEAIDTICEEYKGKRENKKISKTLKKAILTICTTGEGSGKILKEILVKDLEEEGLDDVKVLVTDYSSVENAREDYLNFIENYEIILCAGIIKPNNLNVPFFHLEQLITKKGREKVYEYIKNNKQSSFRLDNEENDIYKEGINILLDHVSFVNPIVASKYIEQFIKALENNDIFMKEDLKLALMLHIGCMLDRKIKGIKISFENSIDFIKKNKQLFSTIRKEIKPLEERFLIDIDDDEICYMIQVLNKF